MVELNFGAGDYVKLRLAKSEIEGTILENAYGSIVLLKLNTGYNVGILRENILGGRALKKFTLVEEKIELPVSGKGKLSVGMIVTGGTIASKLDPKTGGVKHLTGLNEFSKFYPDLFEVVNVSRIEIPFMLASESMSWEHWKKIAEVAVEMLNDSAIEGVIVTHGTDFLHYTSAALSFMLRNLNKPVVLTYSQRSIDRASSDANLNLVCAAQMAVSDCAEVVLVGHASSNDDFCYALPGAKVRKLHSSRRDAFKAVNDFPIAKIDLKNGVKFLGNRKPRNTSKVELDVNFTEKVALVKFYPGQDPSILDYYSLKYKGIVVEGTGLGHLPVSEAENSWIPKLKRHIREGFVVCVATQCVNGRVDPFVYSNGRELLEAGVIFVEDMLAETALVKLGWVLGHYGWKAKIREKMLENFGRELNSKLGFSVFGEGFDVTYG